MKIMSRTFAGRNKITFAALLTTFLIAVGSVIGWLLGWFDTWPVITAIGLHLIWVAVSFQKKLKLSREGIEIGGEDGP